MKLDRWYIICEYVMLGVVLLCIIFIKEVGFIKLIIIGNKMYSKFFLKWYILYSCLKLF